MAREAADDLLDPAFLRRLESLAIFLRAPGSGHARGLHRARGSGDGVAFVGHRAYAPGDEVRAIDWPLYARSERLFVKQREAERDLTLHVLLDCSASMAVPPEKFRAARVLTAALAYLALARMDAVTVQPYDADPRAALRPPRGRENAAWLVQKLALLEARGTTDLTRAALRVGALGPSRSLALLVTDGLADDDLLRGVDLLRHARLAPLVVRIDDPLDDLPAQAGELTLVDAESGAAHTLALGVRTRAAFRERSNARRAAQQRALIGRGVRLLALPADLPIERALAQLIRAGGLDG